MDLVGKDASELLCPHQVGVGISGGAEALIHTCRSWQATNKGDATKALVQVDIRNAFNCLFRTHIRKKTRSRLPALTPWVDYCYAVDSRLHFGPHVLESRRGINRVILWAHYSSLSIFKILSRKRINIPTIYFRMVLTLLLSTWTTVW